MSKATKHEKPAKEEPVPQEGRIKPSIEEALGTVTWLLLRSPVHKYLFAADLEWLILPPLQLMQFRIFRDEKKPLGYITWALVSDAVQERLLQGITKLAPSDWRSGPNVWVVDVVAPFGGAGKMLGEVQNRVFKDREAKVLRPRADAKGVEAKSLKDFLEGLKKADNMTKNTDDKTEIPS